MIRFCWLVLLLLLSSCGIITIEYLPQPPVTAYSSQNDFTKLTYVHTAGTYSSNPDFQGYEVYYKIYAPDPSGGPFTNLAADDSQLASVTPTRDYLVTLGYQRLSANDQNSGNVPLIENPGDGDTITLDFSAFISTMNAANHPQTADHTTSPLPPSPTIIEGLKSFPVYRTVNSGGFSYPWFSDLYRSWTAATSDMSRTGTNAISQSTQLYEIDVFLVAYSFTPEQTIYSRPMPWGVIGGSSATYLKVFQ